MIELTDLQRATLRKCTLPRDLPEGIRSELLAKRLIRYQPHNCYALTKKGQRYAYTLTSEEEQEYLKLLTQNEVVFQHSETKGPTPNPSFLVQVRLWSMGLSSTLTDTVQVSFKFFCP